MVWQIPTDTEPKFGPLLDPKWHRKILGVSVRPMDWFQVGKRVRQGCILSPCLFNLYAEYIMRNARLEEAQLESRLPGEISITSDMQMTPPLWQKVKRNSKAS